MDLAETTEEDVSETGAALLAGASERALEEVTAWFCEE